MNPKAQPDSTGLSRRRLLAAGAGTSLGLATLAACGGSAGDGSAGSYGVPPTSPPSGDDGELVELSDVPVGGAVSVTDKDGKPLIVARPSDSEAVAFSAVCTHRGCTVAPEDEQLRCPCHGSTFDPTTGDNTGGPAPEPLPRVRVSVTDGVVRQS